MNQVSTVGSALLALSIIPFLWNIYITARKGEKTTLNDPWGYGRSLEWATGTPFPRHNFTSIPVIRSESPAFDLNHPESAAPEAKAAPKKKG
jgi:cytochrome c oxidase subunit 1